MKGALGALNIREFGDNDAENTALKTLREMRNAASGEGKGIITEYIREIGDTKTATTPERLAQLIALARRAASAARSY